MIARSELTHVALEAFSCVLPGAGRPTTELEESIARDNPHLKLPPGFLASLAGVHSLTVAPTGVFPSTLAADAGRRCLERRGLDGDDVDMLIFASVSQDVLEPATANIVQQQLGLRCPVMDVKNACNSFLNGMQVAAAFIKSGECQRVLVTTGETPSRILRKRFEDRDDFWASFSGITLGDSGAAVLVEAAESPRLKFMRFYSFGEAWANAMVPGGGIRHLNSEEHMHFFCDGERLKQSFMGVPKLVGDALFEAGFSYGDFAQIFLHQVSSRYSQDIIRAFGMPADRVFMTLSDFGNLVSASIPVGVSTACERGIVNRGDLVLAIGMASGISVGLVVFTI